MQGFRILPLSHRACLARKQLKKARAENTAPAASAGTAGRHRSASVASDHSSVADSASIAAGEGPSPLGGSSSTGIAIDFSAQPSARQRRPSLDSSHLSDVSGTTPPKAPVTLAAADAPPSAQPGPYAGSAEQARSRVKAMQQRSAPGGGRSRSALSSHRFVCVKPHEPQVVHSLRYEAPPRYKSASHVRRFESQPLPPQGSSGRCVAVVPVLVRACMLSGSSFNQPLPTVVFCAGHRPAIPLVNSLEFKHKAGVDQVWPAGRRLPRQQSLAASSTCFLARSRTLQVGQWDSGCAQTPLLSPLNCDCTHNTHARSNVHGDRDVYVL